MTIFSFMDLLREGMFSHGFTSCLVYHDDYRIDFEFFDDKQNLVCSGFFKYIEDSSDNVVSVVAFVYSSSNDTSVYLYNSLDSLVKKYCDFFYFI